MYSSLIKTEVAARCNDEGGRCWLSAMVNRTGNGESLDNPCSWIGDCKIECVSDWPPYKVSTNVQLVYNQVWLIV